MYIGGFYCQPDHFDNELGKLETSPYKIMDICENNLNTTEIIGGNFNAGNINWDENLVKSCSQKKSFWRITKNIGFFPLNTTSNRFHQTRRTPRPFLYKQSCHCTKCVHRSWNISDHDISITDCNIRHTAKPKRTKNIYKKYQADWDKIKKESYKFTETFLK